MTKGESGRELRNFFLALFIFLFILPCILAEQANASNENINASNENQTNVSEQVNETMQESNISEIQTSGEPKRESYQIPIQMAAEAATSSDSCNIDIVFIADSTGSMGRTIEIVKDTINQILANFGSFGDNISIGGVEFGDEIRSFRDVSKDYTGFSTWINGLYANGGGDTPENQLDALWKGTELNGFRTNSRKVFVLMTDAPYHTPGDGGDANVVHSYDSLKTRLLALNISLYAYTSDASYDQLISFTNGKKYGLTETGDSFINNILQMARCIDLKVDKIFPIQVIEDVDIDNDGKIEFIPNKPAMIRVNVSLEGKENVTAEVKLEIKKAEVVVWSKTISSLIKKKYTLNDIKIGTNTVNFFPSSENPKWLPEKNVDYVFNVTVDPNDKIKEYDESNNWKIAEVEVGEQLKTVNFAPLMIRIVDNRVFPAEEIMPLASSARTLWWRDFGFLKRVYPLDPNKIISETDAKTQSYSLTSSTNGWKLVDQIFSDLDKKRLNEAAKGRVVIPAGFISSKAKTILGMTEMNTRVIMIFVDSDNWRDNSEVTLAHEYGHVLGLNLPVNEDDGNFEQYFINPMYGDLSENGWCLDQDTGKSCGVRVNIYKTPILFRFLNTLTGKWMDGMGYKNTIDTDERTGRSTGKVRYFDIMGRGMFYEYDIRERQNWMNKKTYYELIKKLISEGVLRFR